MNNIVKQTLYIIILSIFLGFFRYLFLDEYPLFESKPKKITENNINTYDNHFLELSSPEIIDFKTAKSIYDDNYAVFIDSREKSDFIEGHIKDAINIPFSAEDDYNFSLLDSLYNLDKLLIIYCSGHGCSLSEDLTYYLYEEIGIQSIAYFEEGFPEWKENNYPIKKGLLNDIEKEKKPLFNSIDYLIIFTFILIVGFYLSSSYKFMVPVISRIVLGSIFIYFSIDKIQNPELFVEVTKNYDIIPLGLENIGALILPFLEFIIGFCLILGVFITSANLLVLSLLIFFIFMISTAYIRGKSIDCGCLLSDLSDSSAVEKRIYMLKRIVQDICFIVLSIIVKYGYRIKKNNDA